MRTARAGPGTAAVGVAALLFLSGCTSPWSGPVEQVTVTTEGFSPAALTVSAGTEVRWVNQVAGRVTVTSMQGASVGAGEAVVPTTYPRSGADIVTPTAGTVGQQFDSGPLDQGEAYAVQLDEPGQYVYRSSYQADLGWVGTITVEAP